MNINRHNYEEYFILYADKELSSDERRMVEEFVSLNPDLKDELDIYTNAVILPDASVGFDNKEELHHYDESLITYIDGELADDERAQLEKLINTSPKLKQELDLYRKTKLQPDTDIVFENKAVLYRSTERRRVVPMTIVRWSVAAAVLLAISITAVKVFNKPDAPPVVIVNEKPVTNTEQQNIVSTDSEKKKGVLPDNQQDSEKGAQQNDIAIVKKNEKQKSVLIKASDVIKTQEKQNDNIAKINNQPPSNNLPTANDAINTNPDINSAIAKAVENENKSNVNAGQTGVTILNPSPYIYTGGPTTTNEIDPNEEGGNKKSRGLFRKLTRVFEKNTGIKTTDDDEKLHIAAFTVKLK